MAIFPKQTPQKLKRRQEKTFSKTWLVLGSGILAALLIFFVIGATRSAEIESSGAKQTASAEPSLNTALPQTQTNYTDILYDQILQEIAMQLPDEPTDASGTIEALKKVDLSNAEKSIAESDTNKIFGFSVPPEDIIVSDDNSTQAMTNYLDKLTDIILKAQKPMAEAARTMQTPTRDNPFPLISLSSTGARRFDDAYNQIKKLIVPSSLLDIHTQELQIIKEEEKALTAIANLQQDPYQTLLAIDHLRKLSLRGKSLETQAVQKIKSLINVRAQ